MTLLGVNYPLLTLGKAQRQGVSQLVTVPNGYPVTNRLRVAPGTVLYIATDEQSEGYFNILELTVIYIYIYIYISHTHTHTHTHIYIYIYIYIERERERAIYICI